MPSYAPPKKNTEYIFYVSLRDQADVKLFKVAPTLAAGDVKVSKDGGALANLSTLPTVTPAAGAMVKVTLSATEMNADNVTVVFKDASGAEWCDLTVNLQTAANQFDDLNTTTPPTAVAIRTEIDSNSTQLAAIVADTNELQTDDIPGLIAALNDVDSTAIQTAAASALTAYDPPTKAEMDAGLAALNDLSTTDVRTAVGLASANLDTQLATIVADTNELQTDDIPGLIAALNDLSSAEAQTAAAAALTAYDPPTKAEIDTAVSPLATSAEITALNDPTAAAIAVAVWDEAIAGHLTAGSTGEALDNAGAAGIPPTAAAIADAVWDEAIAGHAAVGSTGEALSDAGGAGTPPTVSEIRAEMDANSTQLAAILADTNELQTDDVPGLIAALNDPTAAAIADAVWDEDIPSHNINSSAGFYTAKVPDIIAELNNLSYEDAQDAVTAALVDESDRIYFDLSNGSDTTGDGSRSAPYQTLNKVFTEHSTQRYAIWLDSIESGSLYITSGITVPPPIGLIIVPFNYMPGMNYRFPLFVYEPTVTGLTFAGWALQDFEMYSYARAINLIDCEIRSHHGVRMLTYNSVFSGDGDIYSSTHYNPKFLKDPNITLLAWSTSTFDFYNPEGDFSLYVPNGSVVNIYAGADTGLISLYVSGSSGGVVNVYGMARVAAETGLVVTADGGSGISPTVEEIRTELDANSTQLAAIVADTNELQTDDIPGLIAALNDLSSADAQSAAAAALTAYDPPTKAEIDTAVSALATSAEIAALNDPTASAIAQAILSEGVASVEDTADPHSLAAAILMMLESAVSGTTLTIYKTDGATTFTTKTVTTSASAEPITGVS